MRQKSFPFLFGLSLLLPCLGLLGSPALAATENQTVPDYLSAAAPTTQPAILVSSSKQDGLETRIYRFVSQTWPNQRSTIQSDAPTWRQQLKIVIPATSTRVSPVLLLTSGGVNHPLDGSGEKLPAALPVEALASQLGIPVAELDFVPNQYLTLDQQPPAKEDGLVAYSWRKFMDNPQSDRFSSLHLPMAQAVEEAMNVIDQFLPGRHAYVLCGASKQGWANWMVGLNDRRVKALVPVVTDFWNIRTNFTHIYNSYAHHWPVAMRDYEQQGVTDDLLANTPGFQALQQYEDVMPFTAAMSGLTKYAISASGDDFAVPDSAWSFLPAMTGPTQVRFLPNASHAVNGGDVAMALLQFMKRWLAGKPLPRSDIQVSQQDGKIHLSFDRADWNGQAKVWRAANPSARDFRFNSGVRYQSESIHPQCDEITCVIDYQPPAVQSGWQSYFIELNGQDLTWTTPPVVWPQTYPDGSPILFAERNLRLGQNR